MASHQKAIHFFKVILKCMLRDGILRIPGNFTRKYGDGLPNPVFLKPPDGTKWKIYWKKHDGDIWFEKGWKEFATYYSLDHWHFVLFKYDGTCNLEVIIFDMGALEIEYPSHVIDDENDNLEQFSDDSVEFLGETPPCQKARPISPLSHALSLKKLRNGKIRVAEKSPNLQNCQTRKARMKSPLPVLHPCKKMRACTNGEDESTSNLKKKPINVELIQVEGRSNFSTKKCSNSMAIRRSKPLTKVEKARALQRVSTFCSEYPHFKLVMQPSYVSKHSTLTIPSQFGKQHLEKKQGAVLLQVLDGRTWSTSYKVCFLDNTVYIYSGWNAFAKDNYLEVGDVCVFELIQRTEATLQVTISRAAEPPTCLVNSARSISLCDQFRSQVSPSPIELESSRQVIQSLPPLIRLGSTIALEEARKLSLDNPSFLVTIKPNHLLFSGLGVPVEFLRSYVRKREKNVLIQQGKQSWPVKLRYYPKKSWGMLSFGWLSFARESKLQAGDVCVFELINTADLVLEVYVSRCHS